LRPEVLVFPLILCSAAVVWAGWTIAAALRRPAAAAGVSAEDRALALLQLFAPGMADSAKDPRALLTWAPLAAASRQLYPEAFALLDRAAGGHFPFTRDQLQAATAEADMMAVGQTPLARARLDAVEREKLELYQRRYEEYVRVSRALQALTT
jgi:hypothetical protein